MTRCSLANLQIFPCSSRSLVLVLGPVGPDLGPDLRPDLDLTWDLDLDLSLTIVRQKRENLLTNVDSPKNIVLLQDDGTQ